MKCFFITLISLCAVFGCAQSHKKQTMENNKFELSEEEWKKKLSPEQYYILREKGTERPHSGAFLHHKEKGTYHCAGCGSALFSDTMKFDSQCGWPSFDREISGGKIRQTQDFSHNMRRTEITCMRCGGHLGHIFDDGPTETGKRYCVNSLSLSFEAATKEAVPQTDSLTLGGGCFWCIEPVFQSLKGVVSVTSGYSGGASQNPSYAEICTGKSGHAEVIDIAFEPQLISLEKLLEVFFSVHNPTTLNRQGADVGTQYRSVIFYRGQGQKQVATQIIAALNAQKAFPNPIVTQVEPLKVFYPAEDYHQKYYEANKTAPYCRAIIGPKLEKFRKIYKTLLNTQ